MATRLSWPARGVSQGLRSKEAIRAWWEEEVSDVGVTCTQVSEYGLTRFAVLSECQCVAFTGSGERVSGQGGQPGADKAIPAAWRPGWWQARRQGTLLFPPMHCA